MHWQVLLGNAHAGTVLASPQCVPLFVRNMILESSLGHYCYLYGATPVAMY